MTRLAARFLIVVVALLAGIPAHAQPAVRHHAEAGEPDVQLQLPPTWSREPGPSGLIVLSNPDRSARMFILLGKDTGTFDEIAAGIVKDVIGLTGLTRMDDLTVDGRPAARFLLDITRANNQRFASILTLVRVDEVWSMNATVNLNASATSASKAEALAVVDSLKLTYR